MSKIAKGLCWAASLILLALGSRLGLIADEVANVLFVALPMVAIMSLRGTRGCIPRAGTSA